MAAQIHGLDRYRDPVIDGSDARADHAARSAPFFSSQDRTVLFRVTAGQLDDAILCCYADLRIGYEDPTEALQAHQAESLGRTSLPRLLPP